MPLHWVRLSNLIRAVPPYSQSQLATLKTRSSPPQLRSVNREITKLVQSGRLEDARTVFDKMSQRNTVTWNTMLRVYVECREITKARRLFEEIPHKDVVSWTLIISVYMSCGGSRYMKEAKYFFDKMPQRNTFCWNTMISGYAKNGRMDNALRLFNLMPKKNVVSWNIVISAYERNRCFNKAIRLYVQMQVEGETPNEKTLSSLLSMCAENAAQHLGMQFHQLVIKLVIPNVLLNTSLITMYAKCGLIHEAETVFKDGKFQNDVISWTAMIGGYASHGFAEKALKHFETMKKFKFTPTYITFIHVLNACAHGGLVEEAISYFRSMVSDFGIEPRVEHYASLVELIGRSGHVEEAMDVISQMPFEPDNVVWGALLCACTINNLELAKVAAEALMKVDPSNSSPYMLLYHIYVDAERWSDADHIRKMMEGNNVKKERGYTMF